MNPGQLIMQVHGVRGSGPAPGPETVRYGGHTACLSVGLDPETTLLFDAGSGLARIGRSLPEGRHTYLLALSHLHWDHISGFPLFVSRLDADKRVLLIAPDRAEWLDLLAGQLDGIRFPLRFRDLRASILPGNSALLDAHGLSLSWTRVDHPGETYGFRLEGRNASLAYVPDRELRHGGDDADRFLEGVECLVHDAQFDRATCDERCGWGHSAYEDTCALALRVGAKRLVLFHHDPECTDAMLDDREQHARRLFPHAAVAREQVDIVL